MLLHKHRTTNDKPESIATHFVWRDSDGEQRTSAITGFQNYAGRNMPRGQYIQADGRRWVHLSRIVEWTVVQS